MNTTPDPYFEFASVVAPGYAWVEWLGPDGQPVRPSQEDLDHPDTYVVFSEEAGAETGPILTPVEGPSTLIRPMDREHATLFRRFADLDPMDMSAIQDFACQYGWLGVGPRHAQVERRSDGSFHHAEGEPHLLWVSEIAKMREAIWLWEHPTYAKRREGKLKWLYDSHLQDVQGRMRFSADGPPQLRIAPLTLLAAMWLQLALAVSGNKEFVKCKHCPRQIEISTAESGFRTNRQFCSQSCKTKDARKRKRTALQLAAKGVPVLQIARKTTTNPATVRGWVAASIERVRGRR